LQYQVLTRTYAIHYGVSTEGFHGVYIHICTVYEMALIMTYISLIFDAMYCDNSMASFVYSKVHSVLCVHAHIF